MGECLPSDQVVYDEEHGRGALTFELWAQDYPMPGDPAGINVMAEDYERKSAATAGMNIEQVRALHRVLGGWLDSHASPRSQVSLADGPT